MTPIYHVGLLAKGRKAVFQFRRTVDELSCEILEYGGRRQTTKVAAIRRLAENHDRILAEIQARYPRKQFNRVTID